MAWAAILVPIHGWGCYPGTHPWMGLLSWYSAMAGAAILVPSHGWGCYPGTQPWMGLLSWYPAMDGAAILVPSHGWGCYPDPAMDGAAILVPSHGWGCYHGIQPWMGLLFCYPVILSSLCNSFQDRTPLYFIYSIRLSNKLQWLDLYTKIKHQDCSSNDECWGDILYLNEHILQWHYGPISSMHPLSPTNLLLFGQLNVGSQQKEHSSCVLLTLCGAKFSDLLLPVEQASKWFIPGGWMMKKFSCLLFFVIHKIDRFISILECMNRCFQ